MSEKVNEQQLTTLVLQDGQEIECTTEILRQKSAYFNALFNSGAFAEALEGRIELSHVDPDAMSLLLSYLDPIRHPFVDWSQFGDDNQEHSTVLMSHLHEAMDYLQVKGRDEFLRSLQIFCKPELIEKECCAQGYVTEAGQVIEFPEGKKKRSWRFWIAHVLVLQLFPEPNVRMDQATLTDKLLHMDIPGSGGPVSLRRELIEFKLLQREPDGSAYWRPEYTLDMVQDWVRAGGVHLRII
jgi:hypothetical protein